MKLAIVSDIHANLEALRATLASISAEGVDEVLCLGDIVGYHADPGECIALLRGVGAVCVAGNHDRAVAGRTTTEGFSATAALGVAWTRERLDADDLAFLAGLPLYVCVGGFVVAVHGALLPEGGCETTRLDTDESRRLCFEALAAHPSGARVCAFGHTHQLGIYELRAGVERVCAKDVVSLRDDSRYLVNPGTVGQPRGRERRATYIVLDTTRRTAAVRRVEYDIEAALAKARSAGLLPPPARRSPVRAAAAWGLRRIGMYDAVTRAMRARARREG